MDASVDTHRVYFEEYCRDKFSDNGNTSKTIWKEKGKRIVNVLRGDPVAQRYSATFKFWVKRGFEVMSYSPLGLTDVLCLPAKKKNPNDTTVMANWRRVVYVGSKKSVLEVAKMYECLPRSAIEKYIELCIICHARKPQNCRAPLRPILASGFMSRGQNFFVERFSYGYIGCYTAWRLYCPLRNFEIRRVVLRRREKIDLIDMRHRPDGSYKWIGHYMDHWAKFHALFPLIRKCAHEVALSLQSVFSVIGTPKILHSDNGREFVNGIIRKLVKDWPGEVVIINGRPRNPKCQGLIEQGNHMVEKQLGVRLHENKGTNSPWTEWLPLIQYQLNTTIHGTMKTTPYELVFGQPPRGSAFPGLSNCQSVMEEDVQDLLEESERDEDCTLEESESEDYERQADQWKESSEIGQDEENYIYMYEKSKEWVKDDGERVEDWESESEEYERQTDPWKEPEIEQDEENYMYEESEELVKDFKERVEDWESKSEDKERQTDQWKEPEIEQESNEDQNTCPRTYLATTDKHIHIQEEADKLYLRNAERMRMKYTKCKRKKVLTFCPGDVVTVRIPRIDRTSTDFHRMPCVVVERRGSKFFLYRLRCAHGVLKVCYGEGDLEPFHEGVNLTAEGWEKDKTISLREAALLSNPLNEFQSSLCNCKSDCTTGRCVCRKNGGQCSSKCHGGRNCSNQPEVELDTNTEILPRETSYCNCKTGCTTGRCKCRKGGGYCSSKCHNGKPCNNEPTKKRTTLPQHSKPAKKFRAECNEEISLSSDDEDLCTPLKNRLRQCTSKTVNSVEQREIVHIEHIQAKRSCWEKRLTREQMYRVQAQSTGYLRNITPRSRVVVYPSDLYEQIHSGLLTGEVIDSLLGIFAANAGKRGRCVYILDNHFFTHADSDCSVELWISEQMIDECDLLLTAANVNKNHWCLAGIDKQEQEILYIDPLGGSGCERHVRLLRRIIHRYVLKQCPSDEVELPGWTNFTASDIQNFSPQRSSIDCGVFTIMHGFYRIEMAAQDFTQSDMIHLRQWLALVLTDCADVLMESRVIRRKLKSTKLKQVEAKDKAEVVWPSCEELIKTIDDCKNKFQAITDGSAMNEGREIVLSRERQMIQERQRLKDTAMGNAMNYYTSTELCALIERLEDICRSSGVKYSDEEFFQLAHDVLFREAVIITLLKKNPTAPLQDVVQSFYS